MGIFDKIGEASAPANTNYLGEGRYLLRIDACKIKEDRNGVDMFVMETTIVNVIQAGDHREGEEASHLVKRTSDYFLPEIKGIAIAVTGATADQITPEVCEEIVSDDQPFAGLVLEYVGSQVETKNSTPENPRHVTRRFYKRAVPFGELFQTLSEDQRSRYFPSLDWEAAIKAESE